jgi:hypothetical protein
VEEVVVERSGSKNGHSPHRQCVSRYSFDGGADNFRIYYTRTRSMVSSLDQRLGARQDDSCLATFLVSAVQQFNRSSMRLGDLARRHQADSAA